MEVLLVVTSAVESSETLAFRALEARIKVGFERKRVLWYSRMQL